MSILGTCARTAWFETYSVIPRRMQDLPTLVSQKGFSPTTKDDDPDAQMAHKITWS